MTLHHNKLSRVFVNAHKRNMKNSFAVRVLSVFLALIIERNGLGFSTTKGKINELAEILRSRQETRNINTCNTTLRANSAQNTRRNNFSFALPPVPKIP